MNAKKKLQANGTMRVYMTNERPIYKSVLFVISGCNLVKSCMTEKSADSLIGLYISRYVAKAP